MIWLYILNILCLDVNTKYFLETTYLPLKRVNIEKESTVRATEPIILDKKIKDVEQEVELRQGPIPDSKGGENYIIKIGNLCIGPNPSDPIAVIAIKCDEPNAVWRVTKLGAENTFELRHNDECMQVFLFDKILDGNFLQLAKCNGSPEQIFKFTEIKAEALLAADGLLRNYGYGGIEHSGLGSFKYNGLIDKYGLRGARAALRSGWYGSSSSSGSFSYPLTGSSYGSYLPSSYDYSRSILPSMSCGSIEGELNDLKNRLTSLENSKKS